MESASVRLIDGGPLEMSGDIERDEHRCADHEPATKAEDEGAQTRAAGRW